MKSRRAVLALAVLLAGGGVGLWFALAGRTRDETPGTATRATSSVAQATELANEREDARAARAAATTPIVELSEHVADDLVTVVSSLGVPTERAIVWGSDHTPLAGVVRSAGTVRIPRAVDARVFLAGHVDGEHRAGDSTCVLEPWTSIVLLSSDGTSAGSVDVLQQVEVHSGWGKDPQFEQSVGACIVTAPVPGGFAIAWRPRYAGEWTIAGLGELDYSPEFPLLSVILPSGKRADVWARPDPPFHAVETLDAAYFRPARTADVRVRALDGKPVPPPRGIGVLSISQRPKREYVLRRASGFDPGARAFTPRVAEERQRPWGELVLSDRRLDERRVDTNEFPAVAGEGIVGETYVLDVRGVVGERDNTQLHGRKVFRFDGEIVDVELVEAPRIVARFEADDDPTGKRLGVQAEFVFGSSARVAADATWSGSRHESWRGPPWTRVIYLTDDAPGSPLAPFPPPPAARVTLRAANYRPQTRELVWGASPELDLGVVRFERGAPHASFELPLAFYDLGWWCKFAVPGSAEPFSAEALWLQDGRVHARFAESDRFAGAHDALFVRRVQMGPRLHGLHRSAETSWECVPGADYALSARRGEPGRDGEFVELGIAWRGVSWTLTRFDARGAATPMPWSASVEAPASDVELWSRRVDSTGRELSRRTSAVSPGTASIDP